MTSYLSSNVNKITKNTKPKISYDIPPSVNHIIFQLNYIDMAYFNYVRFVKLIIVKREK